MTNEEDHAAIHEKLDKLQEDVDTLKTGGRQNAAHMTLLLIFVMQAFVLYLIFWA
ncbi:MAG TPA: hypothetical protein QGG30_01410 [Acidobacteriota bacterium]|jgi:hypothetical protein|nr:hypothetical protein [Acidobacteriota bacterium]|tara:strand:- start:5763 stop:5927 length:165 start_codon:yes stop_codon:yes gene_type:complete